MRKDAPTFEKEILCETTVVKNGKKYHITSDDLRNCVRQYRRMAKNGVTVNVHSGHNHTPETKRGEVLDIYTKKRKDGKVGLFSKMCFLPHLSKKTIQTLVSNDVSVELPSQLYDGKGNFYPLPIQRVAITPDPAVRGMAPFVQQQDTSMSVPFLSLSINNLTEENESMPKEHDELFDPNDEINDDTLPETDDDGETDIEDGGKGAKAPVSGKKKDAFLNSQLAKLMFDACDLDPADFDEEEELVNEASIRLTEIVTIQERLLEALDIDRNSKNKYALLTQRVINVCNFLEQYDADGDGEVDDEDIRQTAGKATDKAPGEDDGETIDTSLDRLDENDKKLELSLNRLQKKYDQSGEVIKGLVAKNRELELDNMLQSGQINKATHKKATERFVLKLSLNDNDSFDNFIEGAKLNSRSASGGHSQTAVQQPERQTDPATSWVKMGKKISKMSAPYKRGNDN